MKRIDAEAAAVDADRDSLNNIAEAKRLDLDIANIEDEINLDYPKEKGKKAKAARAKLLAERLVRYQNRQADFVQRAKLLQKHREAFEYEAQAAADQRDAALALANTRDLDAQTTAAMRDVALVTERSANPRFSRSKKSADVLVEEIKVSALPDAAADVKNDAEFEDVVRRGVYGKFYDHNKVPYGRGDKDPNFIPMAILEDMWRDYATKNNLKKSIPWKGKNKVEKFADIRDSGKIPSDFKLEMLHATGYI